MSAPKREASWGLRETHRGTGPFELGLRGCVGVCHRDEIGERYFKKGCNRVEVET